MTKFTKHRIGLAGASGVHHKRANADCATGGFYKSPTLGQTVSSSDVLNITWDPTCLSTDAIDIYLSSPGATSPRIHEWKTVAFAPGSYQTTLKPKWWNATSSVDLQLTIIEAGAPLFMVSLPAGPVFTATYVAPTSGETPVDADTSVPESATQLVDNLPKSDHLSKGKVAAAVIMPLLIVGAIIAAVYIRMSRKQTKEKRKRWSQAVDKRMSTISTEWKPVSVAGAQAAIRSSVAVDGSNPRASSFSFGAIRPASTVALESGQAGIGAKGVMLAGASGGIDLTTPQTTQLRSGPRLNPVTGERVSRVSFAADTRPSGESRRSQYGASRTSRAFHVGHLPPLPSRQDSGDSNLLSPGGAMSPTQAAGPLSLTVEDINSRMSGQVMMPRPSVDEVLPALSMMRTGIAADDMLLSPQSTVTTPIMEMPVPQVPLPTHQVPKTSSVVGMMPMQPMPASVMSPDEMLRAYASSRGVASPPPTAGLVPPSPIANYNGNGMRTLYSPISPTAESPNRKSLAPTEYSKYDDDDAYIGTAE